MSMRSEDNFERCIFFSSTMWVLEMGQGPGFSPRPLLLAQSLDREANGPAGLTPALSLGPWRKLRGRKETI